MYKLLAWSAMALCLTCDPLAAQVQIGARTLAQLPLGVSTRAPAGSRARAAANDVPPRQVLLRTKFIEVSPEYRKFVNWTEVSGDHPSVVEHEASSESWGVGAQLGYRLGSRPLYGVLAAHYDTGLETSTQVSSGKQVSSEVDYYGFGVGVRAFLEANKRLFAYVWLMSYYSWNNGDFETANGAVIRDNRIHSALSPDFGAGALYLITEVAGVSFDLGYNGMFRSGNADENFRLKLGILMMLGKLVGPIGGSGTMDPR